jgi:hypothetical protein
MPQDVSAGMPVLDFLYDSWVFNRDETEENK